MAIQLVVSGNRILAHGEDCFISMGGTVICPNTERVYQNATVVNCDTIPSDIGLVGYEYHAGEFVPCAPFGVGGGNVAVVCGDDCKAIKDSGKPLTDILGADLLWENASPNSEFAGQTITLKNDKYTLLLIETPQQIYVIGKTATLERSSMTKKDGDGCTWYYYSRTVSAAGNAVTFSNGSGIRYVIDSPYHDVPTYRNELLTANSQIKPLRIYGM